ncbi:protein GVQW3-like, partial [Aphis craccivora]
MVAKWSSGAQAPWKITFGPWAENPFEGNFSGSHDATIAKRKPLREKKCRKGPFEANAPHTFTGWPTRRRGFSRRQYICPAHALTHFHIFLHIKSFHGGKNSNYDDAAKEAVNIWLQSQAAFFYDEGIQNLILRYDKCLIK